MCNVPDCRNESEDSPTLGIGQENLFNLVEFSQRLRAERKARGLNQAAFGALGGVGLQTQSRYEKAETEPQASYLAGLAANRIDTGYLLTGVRSAGSVTKAQQEILDHISRLPAQMQEMVLAQVRAITSVWNPEGKSASIHDEKVQYRPEE